jgi:mannitol/fructose-specific phosphotransferase system IIA component (Ntr-type)
MHKDKIFTITWSKEINKSLFSIVLPKQIFKDLLDHEQTMSTGIPNGIAIHYAKTGAVKELTMAICIKRSDLESHLDSKAHIIIHSLTPMEQGIIIVVFTGIENCECS